MSKSRFQAANLRRILRALLQGTVVAIAMLALVQFADACPTCKEGLAENDPQHASLVRGYFYSILFMMAMPFVILGTFGSFAYLSIRKARTASVGQAFLPDESFMSGKNA
jgi:hypothetical protein